MVAPTDRLMCWACGSIVRAPEFRCDCTKLNTGTQRIIPVPEDEPKRETRRDRFKDMAFGLAWGTVFAFAIFGVMALLGSPLACRVS